jgi:hypothetical protein
MPEKEQQKSGGKGLLFALIGLLVAGNIGQFIWSYQKDGKQDTQITEQKTKIDSLSKEKEEAIAKISQLEFDLQAAIAKSDSLGLNVEDLKTQLSQLQREKRNLLSSKNTSASELALLRDKIANYELMLRQQEDDIRKLKAQNDSLDKYSGELKTTIVAKDDSIFKLDQNNKYLQGELEKGKELNASGFSVTAIKNPDKNKTIYLPTQTYRDKDIIQAKVDFEIGANQIADIEEKEVYIQIVSPNKEVLYDNAKGGGSFTADGKTQNYSMKQNIMYNRSTKKMSLVWDKTSELAVGNYQIKVWCEGKQIGTGSFIIVK